MFVDDLLPYLQDVVLWIVTEVLNTEECLQPDVTKDVFLKI